jgi:hypothetical protein
MMRRLFPLLAVAIFAASPAQARPLQFPQTGAHAFRLDLPRGWNTSTDKRGGLLLVPPENHALIYLAILNDTTLRGQPERAVVTQVAKVAGIAMQDRQEPERITVSDGTRIIRGTAFYGTLPGKRGLARRARIVLFKLDANTWAQVWTVTQPGMNSNETAAVAGVLNSITLTGGR